MIAPTSHYGCGAGDCVECYGDAEWQEANIVRQLVDEADSPETAEAIRAMHPGDRDRLLNDHGLPITMGDVEDAIEV